MSHRYKTHLCPSCSREDNFPKNFPPTLKLLSWSTTHVDYDQANKLLRWFPHNIQAIMAKIKLPKKPLSMVIIIIWIKVRRSYRDWSSQADHARENWTRSYHSIFQLKRTFRVSWKHNKKMVWVAYLDWKRSSGWLESWEGLLLVTDVSTTCAEAIFRAKW